MCGPIQVDSVGANRYSVTFIDDHSRKLWKYLIKRNDKVFDVLRSPSPWFIGKSVTSSKCSKWMVEVYMSQMALKGIVIKKI